MKFKFSISILMLICLLLSCNRQTSEQKPVDKPTKDELKYDQLKNTYQLLGEWAIVNTLNQSTYDYEIYFKKDEHVGVLKFEKLRFETLEKEGNNYFVVGNRYGEYYKINNNNTLTFFDADGRLMEYKAIKKN